MAAHVMLLVTWADSSVKFCRGAGLRAVRKFAAATGATSPAGRFPCGTFTKQTRAASSELRLLWLLAPGLTTSLPQRQTS